MEQSCYIAARPPMLEWAVKLLPDVPRCALEPWDEQIHILESAQRYGCQRVQFFVGRFQEEDVQQAKERRLICNVFYADDEAACRSYLDMGMDNILTNRYDLLKDLVEGHWG